MRSVSFLKLTKHCLLILIPLIVALYMPVTSPYASAFARTALGSARSVATSAIRRPAAVAPRSAPPLSPARVSGITLPFAGFFSSASGSSNKDGDKMGDGEYPVQKSDTEWRAVLSPEQVSHTFKSTSGCQWWTDDDADMTSSG